MEQHKFPEFARHKMEHDALKKQVRTFQADFEAGQVSMTIQVLQFLRNWLAHHIQESDKQYAPYLKSAA